MGPAATQTGRYCNKGQGREYELQYLGLVGNVFSQVSIENCQKVVYDLGLFIQMSRNRWESTHRTAQVTSPL